MGRDVVLVGFLCATALCAGPDYFPLQVGNRWIYRGGGSRSGTFLTIEVMESDDFNGQTYYRVHGFPQQDYWLREDENGSILAYDPDQDQEALWYKFSAAPGESYSTALPEVCCGGGHIGSNLVTYDGPIGHFENALEISYPGTFQVGIERELFLPYVGLVFRGQATGGPSYATYDLIYTRMGPTVISGPELTFSLSLDKSIYVQTLAPRVAAALSNPQMTARLTLRNTQDQPVELTFPTSQIYDLALKNENGDIVYQWSKGKLFAQIVHTEKFGSGEKNYIVLVPLTDSSGQTLPAGKYIAEAWLATSDRSFSAAVGFVIQRGP